MRTPEKNREYQKRWYQANKETHKLRVSKVRNRTRAERAEYIKTLKESTPCADCGLFYPYYVMDFDHQRDKKFLVSRAAFSGMPIEKLKKEIEKCEIVCSNCHRVRTHKQRESARKDSNLHVTI